ncbi:MAG: serine hydrolase domain-containing protein [Lysobacterales bacterium]
MRGLVVVGLCLSALLLVSCNHTEPPATVIDATQALVDPPHLDKVLQGFIDQGKAVGVAALIMEDEREAYFGAFGMADREAGRPMTRDTVAQIYSMTKPLTGVVLMTLYDEGRFQLDEPLSTYLPEYADVQVYVGVDESGQPQFEAPARPILIADILRHTAGFATENDDSVVGQRLASLWDAGRQLTLAEVSRRIAEIGLVFQPGTRWSYGPSVDVQARLAEVLADRPYAELLRERVLDPLQMTQTGYVLADGQRERLAAVYRYADEQFERVDDAEAFVNVLQPWPLTPGGFGLVSTLDDYLRFGQMLLNDGALGDTRILKPGTVALMATDMLPESVDVSLRSWLPSKGQVGFGIDFAVRHSPPADAAENSGAVGEFFWDGYANTLFWVDPKNHIVAVFFTQYVPPSGLDLHKRFRDAVYHRDPEASAAGRGAPAKVEE